MRELPPRLVLYDGVCGLCDRSVQWLLDHDPDGKLAFAPLKGETADELRARHPELPWDRDSVIFVESEGGEERLSHRSRAVFRILNVIGGRWRWLASLRFLPAFLTDLAYRLIAKIRYRVWGKLDQCPVRTPDERRRFLE